MSVRFSSIMSLIVRLSVVMFCVVSPVVSPMLSVPQVMFPTESVLRVQLRRL